MNELNQVHEEINNIIRKFLKENDITAIDLINRMCLAFVMLQNLYISLDPDKAHMDKSLDPDSRAVLIHGMIVANNLAKEISDKVQKDFARLMEEDE